MPNFLHHSESLVSVPILKAKEVIHFHGPFSFVGYVPADAQVIKELNCIKLLCPTHYLRGNNTINEQTVLEAGFSILLPLMLSQILADRVAPSG
jgi:hypothetical protein